MHSAHRENGQMSVLLRTHLKVLQESQLDRQCRDQSIEHSGPPERRSDLVGRVAIGERTPEPPPILRQPGSIERSLLLTTKSQPLPSHSPAPGIMRCPRLVRIDLPGDDISFDSDTPCPRNCCIRRVQNAPVLLLHPGSICCVAGDRDVFVTEGGVPCRDIAKRVRPQSWNG